MNYFTKGLNEIKKYFNILCNDDYPVFIDKYINTKSMQRLKYIGQFCGMDYTKLSFQDFKYWYTRLDHSIACALIAWHLTKDKKQTLAALFHDLGTPVFSHCIDFMLGDALNHESSEKDVKEILNKDKEIKSLLKEDKISLKEVWDVSKYKVLENSKPKLCVDRLEGIFHTGLLWGKFWKLDDIKTIYQGITTSLNEDNEEEICFNNIGLAELFYEGAHKFSMMLQNNDDKLSMQLLGDIVKLSIDNKIFSFDDLYTFKESKIIELITYCKDKKTKYMWNVFKNLDVVYRSNKIPKNKYYVSLEVKKKYVNPLCIIDNKLNRIIDISKKAKKLHESYINYSDSKYAYINYNFDVL